MPHINKKPTKNKMRFGILTVSDTCFKQENIDKSGPQIKALIKGKYTESIVIYEDIVPDELEKIKLKLLEWSEDLCDVIFTTGGTGIADRDVTPEATKAVIEREVPGINFVMMTKSLSITPFAMLSRAVCGIRKKTLIINFPGSVKAVTENFEAVCDIIPHAISLLQRNFPDIQKIHSRLAVLPQIQPKPDTTALPSANAPTLVVAPNFPITPSNVIINTVANRPRVSPYEMVSLDNALGFITMNCPQKPNSEVIPVLNIMGRVLAEDVRAHDPHPPFPASIKDGYAVKVADGMGLRKVVDVKAAGDKPQTQVLQSGECIRVSTGAPIPPGADAVVQVEDTELVASSEDSSKELQIRIKVAPKSGQDIRNTGSDIPAQGIVLQSGHVINAAETGVLAAIGKQSAKVFKPRINQKRSTLNQESRDVVKNVIFYFDQQKNAGGFLFPIEKPTDAAAAAAGVARSTVIKMRREIKDEKNGVNPIHEYIEENSETEQLETLDDEFNEPCENYTSIINTDVPPKVPKKRMKKPEVKQKKFRKPTYLQNKLLPLGAHSAKMKISKDDLNKMEPVVPTAIEIENTNIESMKRKPSDSMNILNKKIKLDVRKMMNESENVNEQFKLITKEFTKSTVAKSNVNTVIDGINNHINESSQQSNGSIEKQIKRIRIEANKNAFLTECNEKLAAVTGVDPVTIKLIKKEVLGGNMTQPITIANKDAAKIKIIKKVPANILRKSTGFKIISKEAFDAMRDRHSSKVNILKNVTFSTDSIDKSINKEISESNPIVEISESDSSNSILKAALSRTGPKETTKQTKQDSLRCIEIMEEETVLRLSIGIISTGNEVQDPKKPLKPGKIRDSNKVTLMSLLKQYSYDSSDCGHVRDDPTLVKYALANAFKKHDVVITTGGVSMGEFDVLKQVLELDFNATIHFGRVNMKPGKPTTFVTLHYNDKYKLFFGLPGNPVSATVTCFLFVIPALKYSEKRKDYMHPNIQVIANFKPLFDPERPDFQRVKLNFKGDKITADSTGNQISSKLNSLAGADGLMLVPPFKPKESESRDDCGYYYPGRTYTCYLLNKF